MSDDLLAEATRALREETAREEAPHEAFEREPTARVTSLTRSRIMASLHEGRRRRTTRAVMALPLVAVFVAGTAWATQAGLLPSFFGAPREESMPATETRGTEPPTTVPRQAPPPMEPTRPSEEPTPVEAPVPVAVEEPPAVPVAPAPSVEAPRVQAPNVSHTPSPPPAPSAAPVSEARRLYERAHRAHFEEKNPAAALAAWEAYLGALPTASKADAAFATEAAYNRALCLVRLGRTGLAREALEPFAQGRYGGYRKDEARALIDALGGVPTSRD